MHKSPFPNVIGICGYAGSGKDTLAKILVENFGYERVAFADKLKEFAFQANPILEGRIQVFPEPISMDEIVWGEPLRLQDIVNGIGWEEAKRVMPEVRETLQRFGMAAREIFGYDVWINAAFKDLDPNKRYVFTDVRLGNEASAIRRPSRLRQDAVGQLWRVHRLGVGPANSHRSETEMDAQEPDFVFVNNKDIDHLASLVNLWAQHYALPSSSSLSSVMNRDEWAKKFPGPLLNTHQEDAPLSVPCRATPLDLTSKPIAHA